MSFNHRIIIGKVLAVLIVAYVVFFPRPQVVSNSVLEILEMVGYVFLVVAALGRIWCAVFIAGRKNDQLVTGGPYSVVRNPLYVFSFFGLLGFCFAIQQPIIAAPLAVLFFAYYTAVIKNEEVALVKLFGAPFESYMKTVPRWIPKFSLYQQPATVEIRVPRFQKDMLDAMWFLWAFLFCELIEAAHAYYS